MEEYFNIAKYSREGVLIDDTEQNNHGGRKKSSQSVNREKDGRKKHSDETIIKIAEEFANGGKTRNQIAESLGVSINLVKVVVAGTSHKELTKEILKFSK